LSKPQSRKIAETAQIAAVRAVEAGQPIGAVAEKMGVSQQSIRNWRAAHGRHTSGVRTTRATVQTLSNDELTADNRALRECLGAFVSQLWRRGEFGEDMIQGIQSMRPETSALNLPHPTEHQQNANGSALPV
jgi:transposase-like protein